MELSVIIQFISTVAVILGIIFGIINLRNFQAMRKREAALMMLNSFQTNEFVRGLLYILDLPDDVSKEKIDSLPHDQYIAIYMVIGTWERLGILVYRHEIEIELVDDAFSGPIIQSWQKLGKYIIGFRDSLQRQTAFEWFQWLAERMMERETTSTVIPAFIAHRNWKSGKKS